MTSSGHWRAGGGSRGQEVPAGEKVAKMQVVRGGDRICELGIVGLSQWWDQALNFGDCSEFGFFCENGSEKTQKIFLKEK